MLEQDGVCGTPYVNLGFMWHQDEKFNKSSHHLENACSEWKHYLKCLVVLETLQISLHPQLHSPNIRVKGHSTLIWSKNPTGSTVLCPYTPPLKFSLKLLKQWNLVEQKRVNFFSPDLNTVIKVIPIQSNWRPNSVNILSLDAF